MVGATQPTLVDWGGFPGEVMLKLLSRESIYLNRMRDGAGTWESVPGREMSREKLVVGRTDSNLT